MPLIPPQNKFLSIETLHNVGIGSIELLDFEKLCNLEPKNKHHVRFRWHSNYKPGTSTFFSFIFSITEICRRGVGALASRKKQHSRVHCSRGDYSLSLPAENPDKLNDWGQGGRNWLTEPHAVFQLE